MKKIIIMVLLLVFVCSFNYADEIDDVKKIFNENIGNEITIRMKNTESPITLGKLVSINESYIICDWNGYLSYYLISQIAGFSFKPPKNKK